MSKLLKIVAFAIPCVFGVIMMPIVMSIDVDKLLTSEFLWLAGYVAIVLALMFGAHNTSHISAKTENVIIGLIGLIGGGFIYAKFQDSDLQIADLYVPILVPIAVVVVYVLWSRLPVFKSSKRSSGFVSRLRRRLASTPSSNQGNPNVRSAA